ncbi:MAG: DUF6062 family protein, partial [Spirochaetaceae bacterium]
RGGLRGARGHMERLVAALAEEEQSCMICDRLDRGMRNFAFTIVSLYRTDEEFSRTFRRSSGFCMPHMRMMLEVGPDVLRRRRELTQWLSDLFAVQDAAVAELQSALETAAGSYDYRKTAGDGREVKTALPRAIRKLAGRLGVGADAG